MEDFPAAHSMDTEWFAVDRDGCVAVFESDEGGAVPRAVQSPVNKDPAARAQWLADLDAMVPVISRKDLYWRIKGDPPGARLLLPRDDAAFAVCKAILEREAPRPLRPSVIPLCDGHALLVPGRPSSWSRLLIRWGNKGVWRALPWEAQVMGRLWASGFVCYVGHGGTPDGAPYERLPLLPRSISVGQLPADCVAQVGIVRLGCSFREKEILQPCEHVSCLGWTDAWTDEHGNRHESGLAEAWRARADG